MIRYGQSIRWTSLDGSVTEIAVSDCDSAKEARQKAIEFAEASGWRPPRWYEFWRWRDTRIPEDDEIDRAAVEQAQ